MCKNCAHCKINDNLLLDSGLCLKPHQVLKGKNFDFIFIRSENTAEARWSKHVSFIVIHIVTLFDTKQKMWWFLTSWCQELSNGILHEWFRSDNFQSLVTEQVLLSPVVLAAQACMLLCSHSKLLSIHIEILMNSLSQVQIMAMCIGERGNGSTCFRKFED